MATAIPDLYSQHMIDYTSIYFKRLLSPFTQPITLFSHRLLLLATLERGAFAPSLYRAPSSSHGQGTAPYRVAHSSVTMRQDGHGFDGDNASSRRPQVPPRPYQQHRLCVLNIAMCRYRLCLCHLSKTQVTVCGFAIMACVSFSLQLIRLSLPSGPLTRSSRRHALQSGRTGR